MRTPLLPSKWRRFTTITEGGWWCSEGRRGVANSSVNVDVYVDERRHATCTFHNFVWQKYLLCPLTSCFSCCCFSRPETPEILTTSKTKWWHENHFNKCIFGTLVFNADCLSTSSTLSHIQLQWWRRGWHPPLRSHCRSNLSTFEHLIECSISYTSVGVCVWLSGYDGFQ